MAFPVAAAIAGGASLGSSVINAASTAKMNKKQRKWLEERYNVERANALADWEMQNKYNSPLAQMQRLKDAGLNPNLVYGEGSVANNSGGVRNTNTGSWSPDAPQIDAGSAALSFYNTLQQTQTIDNLKTQQTLMEADILLKNANTARTLQSTARGEFDLNLLKDLRETTIEGAKANVQKLSLGNEILSGQMGLQQLTVELMANTNDEKIKQERIRTLSMEMGLSLTQKQVELLTKDNSIRQIELNLRRDGINPNDPTYMKFLNKAIIALLKKLGVDVDEFLK